MYSDHQNLDSASGHDLWKGSFKSYMKGWIMVRVVRVNHESDEQCVR